MPEINSPRYWDGQRLWAWNGSQWAVASMSDASPQDFGPGREASGLPPEWSTTPGGGLPVQPWAVMLGGGAVAAGARADQFITLRGFDGLASDFGVNTVNPDALQTSFVCGLVIIALGILIGPMSTRRVATITTRIVATLAALGYGVFALVGATGVDDQQATWFGTETTNVHWSPALGLYLSIGGAAIAAIAAFGLNVRPRPSVVVVSPYGSVGRAG